MDFLTILDAGADVSLIAFAVWVARVEFRLKALENKF